MQTQTLLDGIDKLLSLFREYQPIYAKYVETLRQEMPTRTETLKAVKIRMRTETFTETEISKVIEFLKKRKMSLGLAICYVRVQGLLKQIDHTLYPLQSAFKQRLRGRQSVLVADWGHLRQNEGLQREKVLEAIDTLELLRGIVSQETGEEATSDTPHSESPSQRETPLSSPDKTGVPNDSIPVTLKSKNAKDPDEPNDLITLAVVVRDYQISRAQVKRDIEAGALKSHRKKTQGKHQVSRKDVNNMYTKT